MNLPLGLQGSLEDVLAQHLGSSLRITSSQAVRGGCMHNGCRLVTSKGSFFLKHNSPDKADNFQAESLDLDLLATGPLQTPSTIGTGQMEAAAWLLMEWIEPGAPLPNFWELFGQGLAQLHRQTAPQFGLGRSNFIGTLVQFNAPKDHWADFFVQERLQPQVSLAAEQGLADHQLVQQFERLYKRMDDLIPPEPPSLLHGDLWSGNFMVDQEGKPVLIDPAVYHGHREAEIAFTKLFGGFAPSFYRAYNEAWPLQNGWENRVDLFNLYPLAVHLNLFGRGYLPEIQSILARYN